jgi:hypothetical protein
MLEELGVSEERRLKCNAHILLANDNALNKTFSTVEMNIGTEKLISTDAAHVFSSSKDSIWILGLIAFAKLLSPSHCQESISLYSQYQAWLKIVAGGSDVKAEEAKDLLRKGFKGFQANRFGRCGNLSETYILHKSLLDEFFEECIDEHANKLHLACFAYLNSPWFLKCCRVADSFNTVLTVPFKEVLGLDEGKCSEQRSHTWLDVKMFLHDKLKMLDGLSEMKAEMSTEEILTAKGAHNIKAAMEHQMEYMPYLKKNVEGPENETLSEKMQYAPISNLGAESDFAKVGNALKRSGGSTSLETISNRHLISENKLFQRENWNTKSDEEKNKKWNWARNSVQAKQARKLQDDFLNKVQATKTLALKEKEKKKNKKNQRTIEALAKCKEHGGPMTEKDVDKIETMNEKQLKQEISYLRLTVAPNIRQRSKEEGNFSVEKLRIQIRNAIKPVTNMSENVDTLLFALFSTQIPTEAQDQPPITENHPKPGLLGWWEGPLDQRKVGIVLDSETLQLYESSRYGFLPSDAREYLPDWNLLEHIEEYKFFERPSGLFLRF